ncbi:MAG TPA: P-type conjugative transfer protein TrbJ [Terriglobia bacterium]|nr:P-type conjugative transfer protein TrbJ [Terriglobia bacterium]
MKYIMSLTLAATLILQLPALAHAQLPFGIGASEATQLLNHGELVNQYLRQAEQLAEALKQTADMIKNSQLLTTQAFGPITSDINRLSQVVQGGSALAYSLANLDALYRERFRGYAYNAKAYYTDYRDWSQTSLDTTRSAMRAAGVQSDQLQNEQTVLTALRAMTVTADGRMQALQVANQIAEQQVEQLMKLRALMLVDLQSKQAFQAVQMQREAATAAAAEAFFKYSRQSSTGNTFQAGWK